MSWVGLGCWHAPLAFGRGDTHCFLPCPQPRSWENTFFSLCIFFSWNWRREMVMEIRAKPDGLLSSHQTRTFSAGLQYGFGFLGLRLLRKAVGADFPLKTLAGHRRKNSSGEGLGVAESSCPPPSPVALCRRRRIRAAAHPDAPLGAAALSGRGFRG